MPELCEIVEARLIPQKSQTEGASCNCYHH
jgi:hypothetical protein